jgi:hypothetical protein
VLADFSRQGSFVSFVPTVKHATEWAFYFSVDEDSRFRVTFLQPFDFHGQLRVRATSGGCAPADAKDARAFASQGARSDERCERGELEVCLTRGKETEARDRVNALRLYMRGCEQARADEPATRPLGVKACTEAARLCSALGFTNRAEDYRNRARALSPP